MPAVGRPKGQPKTGGRVAGTPNKYDGDIKQLIIGALNKAGGVDYLAARALDQPVAFMGLIGRVLPLQVTGKNGGALAVDFRWADPPPTAETVVDTIVGVAVNATEESEQPDLIEWAKPEAAD